MYSLCSLNADDLSFNDDSWRGLYSENNFHLCIAKKDLAKTHFEYQLKIYKTEFKVLSKLLYFFSERSQAFSWQHSDHNIQYFLTEL